MIPRLQAYVNTPTGETVRPPHRLAAKKSRAFGGLSVALGLGGFLFARRRKRRVRPDPRHPADRLRANGTLLLVLGILFVLVFGILLVFSSVSLFFVTLLGGSSGLGTAIGFYLLFTFGGFVMLIMGVLKMVKANRLERQRRPEEYRYEYLD